MGSRITIVGLLVAFMASVACAHDSLLTAGFEEQRCSGMWNKQAWGGVIDPAITVQFQKTKNYGIVSLVIFEFKDERFLGRYLNEDSLQKIYICGESASNADLCDKTDIGKFILDPSTNSSSSRSIYTIPINLNDAELVHYPVTRTGYYCVWAHSFSDPKLNFSAVINFQNSYGKLPAAQIPKLSFYGSLTIISALIGVFWTFLYIKQRKVILPVQKYITAIIIFLVVEMLITWAFYYYMNVYGMNTLSRVLIIVVAVLNAARSSFSFFLLLIVCMGYGVVKLGPTKKWIRILAVSHFIFSVVYATTSLIAKPENAGPLMLLVIFPLITTLTAFYLWTLNSLKHTMKELAERNQNVKLLMYKWLWWILLSNILVIFSFISYNSLILIGQGVPNFTPTHWKTRWFLLDGWLNLLYIVDVGVIAWLWRPTADAYRFTTREEIAQDDVEFKIASIVGFRGRRY